MCVGLCVCEYVCLCVCVCVGICVYVCVFVCMLCVCVWGVYLCMFVCLCACVCVYVCVFVCACVCVCVCIYRYFCAYVWECASMNVFKFWVWRIVIRKYRSWTQTYTLCIWHTHKIIFFLHEASRLVQLQGLQMTIKFVLQMAAYNWRISGKFQVLKSFSSEIRNEKVTMIFVFLVFSWISMFVF